MKHRSPTEFEAKVYAAVSRVPSGRVTTYALLAKSIKCRSARAIGQALKRNPFSPIVPCHRVISTNLKIGGFTGQTDGTAIVRKRKLLADEGVLFQNGLLLDEKKLISV